MNTFIQIVIGYFLADFIGGLLHWFEDTYLPYDTSIPLLSTIAKDNEMHHYFPRSILAYSLIESLSVTLTGSIIIIFTVYLMSPTFLLSYKYLWASFFIFGSFSNNFHKLSHMRDCEKIWIVKQLQHIGMLCSSSEHREHHVYGRNKYCVNTNYLNWILDPIGFWRILEYLIDCAFNIKPQWTIYDDYTDIQLKFHLINDFECPMKPSKADVETMKEFLKYKYNKY
jgi:hypothetical protein